ncbi:MULTISPECIES: WxL protein peptidoglycan domain-containing protein [Lactococcus]|uniref:WxL protein peptidoglycan domain-containing protein n=1 Tax=Lactococcus TaxID=1357 RepID=UPI000EDAD917|nr:MULTISPECIES: DUF916 domain-containing protein [Lactococcus]HAP15525.1 hypothetical protein [Lactococcus sp.]
MKKIVLLILGCAMLVLAPKAEAEEGLDNQAMDFSAQAIPSEAQKQNRKDLSYWWLDISDEKEFVLYIEITNGKVENTFDISANQAITNENLVIDYSLENRESQEYLYRAPSFDFYKNVKIGEEGTREKIKVTLAPYERRRIPITISLSQELSGQAIGGINVSRHTKEAERTGGILNVYNRAFALVLDTGEVQASSLKLSLGKLEVAAQTLQLINPNHRILSGISVDAVITADSGEKVSELKTRQGVIVPQAKITLPLNNEKRLERGEEYKLSMRVKIPEEEKEQRIEYTLIVDNEDNITAEPVHDQPQITKIFVIAASIFFIISLFSFAVFKGRKKQTDNSM